LSVAAGLLWIKRRGQTCGYSPIGDPSRQQGPGNGSYCSRASDQASGDQVAMKALISEIAERKSNLSVLFVAVGDQPQTARDAAIATP